MIAGKLYNRMMKNCKSVIFLFVFSWMILNLHGTAKGFEVPSFIGFENMKVVSSSMDKITLVADMVLTNPNKFSVWLRNFKVRVLTENDVLLTEIEQGLKVEMPPNKDFRMPVLLEISPDKLIENGGGLWNTLVSSIKDRGIVLKYRGSCKVEIRKIPVIVPIAYKEKMVF